MNTLSGNPAVIGFIGVIVGALLTGFTNFFLQRAQDSRRFEHETKARQEQETRENELRNYDDRRRAYVGFIQSTDPETFRLHHQENPGDGEFLKTIFSVQAEMMLIAPRNVLNEAEGMIDAFLDLGSSIEKGSKEKSQEETDLTLTFEKKRVRFLNAAKQDLSIMAERSIQEAPGV